MKKKQNGVVVFSQSNDVYKLRANSKMRRFHNEHTQAYRVWKCEFFASPLVRHLNSITFDFAYLKSFRRDLMSGKDTSTSTSLSKPKQKLHYGNVYMFVWEGIVVWLLIDRWHTTWPIRPLFYTANLFGVAFVCIVQFESEIVVLKMRTTFTRFSW